MTSKDPLQRRLQAADALRAQGQDGAAEAAYRALARVPEERRQVARRARLRLAQYALARSDYDEADVLVRSSMAPGSSKAIRQQTSYILRRTEYERSRNAASAAMKAVDDRRRKGAPLTTLLADYSRLVELPCPYPPDFRVRAHERLSEVRAASGDYPIAHRELDLAEQAIPAGLSDGGAGLKQRLFQDRANLRVDELVARADSLAVTDPVPAKALYADFLASPGIPAPSPNKLMRVHLKLADLEADTGNFAAARAQVDGASRLLASDDEQGRQGLAQQRIDIDALEMYAGSDAARSSDSTAQRAFLSRILAMAPHHRLR
ncbi:hypothetical protein [Novosphingobium sp. 9]|uniref:hypothetical protein n=1 Tax=Novosphingobium sp. 9 TaxID=2025349 RepID=UPI0021B597FC|nr:hypothetical protein [Novosphingobium sp. 9]